MKQFIAAAILVSAVSCKSNAQEGNETAMADDQRKEYEITKTEQEWQKQLTAEEFNVLREAGTERPFTSPLNDETSPGTLVCAACKAPVYDNKHKFKSGTGWPSYDRAIDGQVERDVDYKIGYARTELKCATCGSHLGHEFDDGPRDTTGKRHCINGVALDFVPEGQELPPLNRD
ncbi:peptide-methionine (R)-S-oxide reductase MsrB [Nonlabens ponticola]